MLIPTKETIEIKAGELNLKVPYTTEGLYVVRAMFDVLEAELPGQEKIKTDESASPKLEGNPPKIRKTSEDKTKSPYFSPPLSSPKQRIKFKNWEAIATTKSGTLYKEVVDRFLTEYKNNKEPIIENLFQIIREMYGKELKNASIATYVSTYKRYIRENKLAPKPKPSVKEPIKNNLFIAEEGESTPKHTIAGATDSEDIVPIDKVAEIWNLLPDEFEYKKVKALVPIHISQSTPRIDATNFIIKQFLDHPLFDCEETSPGVFVKRI